jgi:uncharacterized surface protein with fasciclin (FAS1) repeats
MKNTSPLRRAAVLAAFVAPFVGCAVATAAGPTTELRTAGPTGECDWVDPAAVADLPVDEAADELSELITMSAAISATDLSVQLADDGPYTIFAPSNDAFTQIPENVWDSIIADPELLSSILGYHVVVGEALSADDLVAAGSVETLSRHLAVSADGDTIVVNDGEATVTCAGIRTGNATIFVIDHVLQPASNEISGGGGCAGSSVPGSSLPDVSMPPEVSMAPEVSMGPDGSTAPGGSIAPGDSVPGSSVPC